MNDEFEPLTQNFDPKRFAVRTEGPLCDRKRQLPNLQNPKEKAEFIRDLIAMANTARMLGKPAHLLYGVDDNDEIVGCGPLTREDIEKFNHRLSEAIRDHIEPSISGLGLEAGQRKTETDKIVVAHLTVQPRPFERPFCVSRELRGLLRKGQCWIRFGESKREVSPEEIADRRYADTPFLMPPEWVKYFRSVQENPPIREATAMEENYQPLRAAGPRPLEQEIERFLEGDERVLFLIGPAGCGKTLFLRLLVAKKAANNEVAMNKVRWPYELVVPPDWVPVYFPLRNANFSDGDHLAKGILREANRKQVLWAKEPRKPERLFEQRLADQSLRWLICLDGLDEMEPPSYGQFESALRQFVRRFPQVKVIVATRPDVTIPGDFFRLHVEPFLLEDVRSYLIRNLPEDGDELYAHLSAHPELRELYRIPLWLESLVNSLRKESRRITEEAAFPMTEPSGPSLEPSAEPPVERLPAISSEELINLVAEDKEQFGETPESPMEPQTRFPLPEEMVIRSVREIWERETMRRIQSKEEINNCREALEKLASNMDGHRLWAERREVRQKCRKMALSLGILRQGKALAIGFCSHLVRVYFAACYLCRQREISPQKARRIFATYTAGFQRAMTPMLRALGCDFEPEPTGGVQ